MGCGASREPLRRLLFLPIAPLARAAPSRLMRHGLELCSPSISLCCGWRAAGTRALDDGNQLNGRLCAAAAGRRCGPIGRRFGVLASPIDGSQRALIDNDVLARLLVSYRPLAPSSHNLGEPNRALIARFRASGARRGLWCTRCVRWCSCVRRRAPQAEQLRGAQTWSHTLRERALVNSSLEPVQAKGSNRCKSKSAQDSGQSP